MTFYENFAKIEEIKEKYETEYAKQKFNMMDYLVNISKTVLDFDGINNKFADLVSDYLSKSDFKVFGDARIDKEVMYVSDATGYGDCFTFLYNSNKQVDTIRYQSSDKRVNITLKQKDDKVYLTKVVDQLDGSIRQIKSTYIKEDDMYYQKTYSDKLIDREDDLTTYGTEELEYNKENDTLTKTFSMVTKDESKILSRAKVSTVVDNSEYVIEEGLFYLINRKEEKQKILKVKELENKLVKKLN